MPNLFWKDIKDKTVNVVESPFRSEEEFESYIYKTEEILGDIFILKRQIRVSSGRDILDMVGIDKENNIVIIEMKNCEVDENIIPQVLRYAIWAETNPDSIKALWLELKDKPEDIDINWDNLSVKIIIIAPTIKPSAIRLSGKINYPIDLLEIKRFEVRRNEFILVNKLEPELGEPSKPAKGKIIYDRKYYLENYNKESVEHFFKVASDMEKLIKKKNWKLERKPTSFYIGFKYGFLIVFGVMWIGTKSFTIFFKITKQKANSIKIPGVRIYRYDDQWKQALYKVDVKEFKIEKLLPLCEAAYKNITGL